MKFLLKIIKFYFILKKRSKMNSSEIEIEPEIKISNKELFL